MSPRNLAHLVVLSMFVTISTNTFPNHNQNQDADASLAEAAAMEKRFVHSRRRAPPDTHPPPSPSFQPTILQLGQCDTGTNSSGFSLPQPTANVQTGRDLYVDFGVLARCSGIVLKWEFCYTVNSTGPGPSTTCPSEDTITIVILRRDGENEEQYHIVNVYIVELQELSDQNKAKRGETVDCLSYSIDSQEDVVIQQGDLLGFVNGERARICMTSTFQQDGGMLRVHRVPSVQHDMISGADYLRRIRVIPDNQFESQNQSLTPVLRVIMNETSTGERNNTTNEAATTTTTTHSPCSTDNDRGLQINVNTLLTNTIFLSVVVATSSVIFLLLVMVLILSCCLCHIKCRHCKLCRDTCSGNCFHCCQGNDQVDHRIKIEPLSSALDQSMEYNELYTPSSRDQRLRIHQGSLHKNPAYSSVSTSKGSGINEIDGPKMDKIGFEESTALEHTYEMIDTLRY